jgi:hypothetical protein|tara:strand:+ start:54 stop:248 length:195 start_codon:yes stop_codon:yes gene_type:complete
MSWTGIKKEWCKVVLFNKIEICLKAEFNVKDLDVFIIGGKVRDGIAVGILGALVAIEYRYVNGE